MTVGCNSGHLETGCKAVEYGIIWAKLIYFCLAGPFPWPVWLWYDRPEPEEWVGRLEDCYYILNIIWKVHDFLLSLESIKLRDMNRVSD
jgi:hypothetical protein